MKDKTLMLLLFIFVLALAPGVKVKASDEEIMNSDYTIDKYPLNVQVETKRINGNLKDVITWDLEDLEGYKVEVYSKMYVKYLNTNGTDKEAVKNAVWKELSLPLIKCVVSDAKDCKAYVDREDIWSALVDIDSKGNDVITDVGMDFMNWWEKLWLNDNTGMWNDIKDYYSRLRYSINDSVVCDYVKYSRVRYFVRYIREGDEVACSFENPVEVYSSYYIWDSLGGSETQAESIISYGRYAMYKRDGLNLLVVQNARSRRWAQNGRLYSDCYYDSAADLGVWIDQIVVQPGCDWHYRNNLCPYKVFKDRTSAVKYVDTGFYNNDDIIDVCMGIIDCSKFVECGCNVDSENVNFNGDEPYISKKYDLPSPEPSVYDGDNKYNPQVVEEESSDEEDGDTVYWLKKIYRRVTQILTYLIVDNIVDRTTDIINNFNYKIVTHGRQWTNKAKTKFPFSMLFFYRSLIGMLNRPRVQPKLSTKFDLFGQEFKYQIDFSMFDKYFVLIRKFEMIAFAFYLGVNSFAFTEWMRNNLKD